MSILKRNEMSNVLCYTANPWTIFEEEMRDIFHSEKVSECDIVKGASESSVDCKFTVPINNSGIHTLELCPCFGLDAHAFEVQFNLKNHIIRTFSIYYNENNSCWNCITYFAIFLHWSCDLKKLAAEAANLFRDVATRFAAWTEGDKSTVHVIILDIFATC